MTKLCLRRETDTLPFKIIPNFASNKPQSEVTGLEAWFASELDLLRDHPPLLASFQAS